MRASNRALTPGSLAAIPGPGNPFLGSISSVSLLQRLTTGETIFHEKEHDMKFPITCYALAALVAWGTSTAQASSDGPTALPGRPVKVAAVAIGFGGDHDQKLKLALEHLEVAGQNHVDIVCLPEEFSGTTAEPVPGPTTEAVGSVAARYHMYVVCPMREQAPDGRQYNTAVLLDRAGKVAGRYRKIYVFWGEGLNLGEADVPVFDVDFGRIAVLTCFDANYSEVWQQAERKGAELVFWPSAYGGGLVLNGYAMIHNFPIVAVGQGNIIDITGQTIENVEKPREHQFITTLDLDRTLIHTDFNGEKVKKLLRERADEVQQERFFSSEAWYLLRATKPGVRVRDLCKEYQIETLRDYRHRSREQINEARKQGKKI